jgi:DNA-binding NtrC family response regulator
MDPDMTKDRILVIDDEAAIRSSLQGILEDEGYAVQTAETGEEGLDLLGKGSFGLVLLDIWLPKMSGLDVLAEIRKAEDRPRSWSSPATARSRQRSATKLRAFDFLEKPCPARRSSGRGRALRTPAQERTSPCGTPGARAIVDERAHPAPAGRDPGRSDQQPRPHHRRARNGQSW